MLLFIEKGHEISGAGAMKANTIVRGLGGICYREWLISLKLFLLYYRRIRGHLPELFKIYKGIDELNYVKLLMVNSNHTYARGYTYM